MIDKEQVKEQIRLAFTTVEYPGDWCLRGSNEGHEPFRVERDFMGKTDWRTLDTGFIDRSPDGLGSALSFFSDEAFHFYLPAYMIADIDDVLEKSNPVFHLTPGLTMYPGASALIPGGLGSGLGLTILAASSQCSRGRKRRLSRHISRLKPRLMASIANTLSRH